MAVLGTLTLVCSSEFLVCPHPDVRRNRNARITCLNVSIPRWRVCRVQRYSAELLPKSVASFTFQCYRPRARRVEDIQDRWATTTTACDTLRTVTRGRSMTTRVAYAKNTPYQRGQMFHRAPLQSGYIIL